MIRVNNISKIYKTKNDTIKALDRIDLKISQAEFVIIRGPSGSGKTTLLMSLGGMLRPTSGRVVIDKTDIYKLNSRERAKFRANHIGFIFQMFHLIPYLNVTDNILLSAGTGIRRAEKGSEKELISRAGMAGRRNHKPAQLSTGEKQRTAIARALFNRPVLILADEPTGNLDPANARDVITRLKDFQKKGGTVVIATHGTLADKYADKIILLQNGRIKNIKTKK